MPIALCSQGQSSPVEGLYWVKGESCSNTTYGSGTIRIEPVHGRFHSGAALQAVPSEVNMDIVSLIIQLISGAAGGNAAGALLKKLSLGPVGNSIVGFWRRAGGQLLGMLGS